MQQIAETRLQTDLRDSAGLRISAQALLVLLIVLLSLALRIASLGAAPMNPAETHNALAALRDVQPAAPGADLIADSPLIYWTQRIAFGLTGGGESASRIGTALAGVLLGLSPLLFVGLLGRARAIVATVLLSFSPVMIAASRFSGGAVWSMLFALVGIWALWRYSTAETRAQPWAIGAFVAFAVMAFLSEPGGPLLLIILMLTASICVLVNIWYAPDDADLPGNEYLDSVRLWLVGLPWSRGLIAGLIAVVIASTLFLLDPSGLGMVGQLLDGFFTGFTRRAHPYDPLFFPLLTSFYYEPWLWLVGAIAVAMLWRRDQFAPHERFLVVWLVVTLVFSLIYRGASAADGLWLSVPLIFLAAYAIADAFDADDDFALYMASGHDFRLPAPVVAKAMLAVISFFLFVMVAVHFQMVARGFLVIVDGSLGGYIDRISDDGFSRHVNSVIWMMISLMFLAVGYFLAASFWGGRLPAQAILIGFAAFSILTNAGSGWRLSVPNATDPVEAWHSLSADPDAASLRRTLLDLAFRETKGFPGVPVAVMAPDDGVVAWQLRDFVNARYVDTVDEARREQVILLPKSVGTEPDLGGNYLGQSFVMTRTWTINLLVGFDFLPWWAQQQTRFASGAFPDETYVLWVRQDIYDSNPFATGSG